MSDPIAVVYDSLIREELKRQAGENTDYAHEAVDGRICFDGFIDVEALAKVLARPPIGGLAAVLEPAAAGHDVAASAAISLKRIADVLVGDKERGTIVLEDLSHNHAQRMRP